MSSNSEFSAMGCVDALAHRIEEEYSGVTVSVEHVPDLMSVLRVVPDDSGALAAFVSVSYNGEFALVAHDVVHEAVLGDPEDCVDEIWSVLQPFADQGVALVRAVWWLGRLSPSWADYWGAPALERLTSRWHSSRVVYRKAGWAKKGVAGRH